MEPEEILVPEIDTNDSDLDASIASTISQIKAEQNGSANPTETTEKPVEVTPPATSVEAPSAEDATPKESQPEDPAKPYEFKTPVKGKFESEESFNLRVQLANLVHAKKAANNPEAQQALQDQIKELRNEMRTLKPESVITRSQSSNSDEGAPANVQPQQGNSQDNPTDPNVIAQIAIQQLQEQQHTVAMAETINDFFGKNPEFQDQDVRDVFIEFFDSNYKLEGKTPAQAITTLELAKQAMFRPDETIQERALKAAGVQKEVSAMQFPGGSVPQQGVTQEQQNSINEMVAAGISEERARALILD